MKRKLTDKKRKILRRIFGALSFTTALFVFQACYGTPQDFGNFGIRGTVKSKITNQVIPGIKVLISNTTNYTYTDPDGYFVVYVPELKIYNMRFEDIDSENNGIYSTKDTTFAFNTESTRLNVYLNDK